MAEFEPSPGAEVLKLLGATRMIKKGLTSPEEILVAVRSGLPFSALEALQKEVELTTRQLADVLGIPERTIARRKEERQLTAAESDRLYRVARMVAHAEATLGDLQKARAWLKRPNRALGDEEPLTLLDTDIGARQVEDVLLRLSYGIHS